MKLTLIGIAAAFLAASIDAKTLLFPIPQSVNWTGHISALHPSFNITGSENQHVQDAAKRYLDLIITEKWDPVQPSFDDLEILSQSPDLTSLDIRVNDNFIKLDAGIDESYTLDIPTSGGEAVLAAETWVGALRGLETFSQLILGYNVHTVNIQDYPAFGHRGVLLDTARNFYSTSSLLRTIDAMAYNKMNVFHWHATDSQSWPLFFQSHPELSSNGAYSSKEVYTPVDVQLIKDYAESRGVRVIIEIDMPAHTASIGESHPDYIVCGKEFWAQYAAEPPAGQLHPLNRNAWDLVKDVVREATTVFTDSLYHTGGDEINAKCWELDPIISEYTRANNITTHQLWNKWEDRLLDFVINTQNKRPIIWEDMLKDGGKLPEETIIQIWTAPAINYTSKGHDVIVSSYDYFYLDCGNGGWVGDDPRYISPSQTETANDTFNYGGVGGSWCAPFKTWQRIYSYDMTLGIPADSPGKILGGEVAVWSEQTDHHVIDGRLWPRGAAAAEIYWSGSYDKNDKRRTVAEVQPRFYEWVYRLQARGINATPVQPKWCLNHPGRCNLNDPALH
ncbi:glycoside hydrolase superfamily [Phycomyces nitens]|nr:glycoside hydrolase superfamily [Phycomyces nitens]